MCVGVGVSYCFGTLWCVGRKVHPPPSFSVRRSMAAPAVAASLFVLSALCSCHATPCDLPQPGKCTTDNSSYINNTQVCGLDAGSCRFTGQSGLCSYRQGCADPGMSNWTASKGKAEVRQERVYSYDRDCYHSVLESPWLNFSQVSCLRFTYERNAPAALDVFLHRRNGDVLTILNRSDNANNDIKVDIRRTINPGIGKVTFRAYGGSGINSTVKVFKVLVEPGHCTWAGAVSMDEKQMTSPLISPTAINQNRTDCLRFQYRTQPPVSWLTVSIQLHLEEQQTSAVLWNHTSSGPQSADIYGVCPVQVNGPFKIIFTHSSSPGDQVNVSGIEFRRWQEKEDCQPLPIGTNTSATDTVISSSGTVSPASSGQCAPLPPSTTTEQTSTPGSRLTTTRPLMTSAAVPTMTSTADATMTSTSHPTPDTTHPVIFSTTSQTSDHSEYSGIGGPNSDEDSDSFTARVLPAIVAAIGVVIIIIIIIVVVVLLIRRRRRSKKDQSESPTQRQDESNGVMASRTQDNRRDSYSEICASHFDHPIPVEDSGYFESDEVSPRSPDPDIDPYEQIPEDTPGYAQDPEDDDYSRISARAFPDGAVPPETAEDDYHHISTPGSAPTALASSAYTQVQKRGKPVETPAVGYAYTRVNKQGKKMALEDPPDLDKAYSGTSQKPAVAPKPGHRKGDTAATKTQHVDDENLDGVSDTYNRINASGTSSQHSASCAENRPDPETDTYNRIDMASGSGKTGPSPSVDVDDDYNSLDFDNRAQAHENSIGSYDHVCNNPDDDYSRADGGKRLVVMDSSYDRVRYFDA